MDASPFNDIPAEIHMHVCDLALTDESPIRIAHRKEVFGTGLVQVTRPYLCALLRTCKQVRIEALPVFYEANVFEICIPCVNDCYAANALVGWRGRLATILPILAFVDSLQGADKPPRLETMINFGTYDISEGWRLNDLLRLITSSAKLVRQQLQGRSLLKVTATYRGGDPISLHTVELILDKNDILDSSEAIFGDLKERARMPGVNAEHIHRLRTCFEPTNFRHVRLIDDEERE